MPGVAIDLGTCNTRIHLSGAGTVLDEPSVVAVEHDSGTLVAAGVQAKRMVGRTPRGVVALQPLRNGIIADITRAELMLGAMLERALPRRMRRSAVSAVVCVPCGSSALERRAVRQAVYAAGIGSVRLITESMATAVGAGLPVTQPRCSMVVNVGGGTTEVAVISLSGTVAGCSVPCGGSEMDLRIAAALRKELHLLVGESTAEALKIAAGSDDATSDGRALAVVGRHLVAGLPGTAAVDARAVRAWIAEPVRAIVAAVRQTLERTPAELSADLVDAGMVLSGGGAFLAGLGDLLGAETGMRVVRDASPLTTAVRGAAMVLSDLTRLEGLMAA